MIKSYSSVLVTIAVAGCTVSTRPSGFHKEQSQKYETQGQQVQLTETPLNLSQLIVPSDRAQMTYSTTGEDQIILRGPSYEPSYSAESDRLVFKGYGRACDICYLSAATKPADVTHTLYNFGEGSKPQIAEHGNVIISDKRPESYVGYYLAMYDLEKQTQTLFLGTNEVVWASADASYLRYYYGELENSQQMQISPGGRYVVYVGNARAKEGSPEKSALEVFLLDREAHELTQVSENEGNNPSVNDRGQVLYDEIQRNERVVVFYDPNTATKQVFGPGRNPSLGGDTFAYETNPVEQINNNVGETQLCYGSLQTPQIQCTYLGSTLAQPVVHESTIAYVQQDGVNYSIIVAPLDVAGEQGIGDPLFTVAAYPEKSWGKSVKECSPEYTKYDNEKISVSHTFRLFSLNNKTLSYDNDGFWCVAKLRQ